MELIERLTQLENEERRVSTELASVMSGGSNPGQSQMNGNSGQGGSGSPKDGPPSETDPASDNKPAEATDDEAMKKDGQTDTQVADLGKSTGGDAEKDSAAMNDEASEMEDAGKSPDELRKEVEERQHAAAIEARDIETKMQQIPLITELARERMAEAAKTAESGAETLTRGDTSGAMEQVKQAEQMLGELRKQAEALLKEEISQRIAAARDLASRLAQQQAQLQSQLNQQANAMAAQNAQGSSPMPNGQSQSPQPGSGSSSAVPQTPEETKAVQEALADAARKLAETGRTLEDVTKAIANSEGEQDQDSAAQVARVRDEQQLSKQIEQMQKIADQIEKNDLSGAQAAAGEVSQRLEVTAQELEQVHRRLVAPRLAKLMELEAKVMAMIERLKELETTEDVAGWHREAQELLDEIDKNQLGGAAVDQLRELLAANANGADAALIARTWNVSNNYFVAPEAYRAAAQALAASLQQRIQEICLGDMESDSGGAVPPEYERLVERYYEVLSSGKDE